MYSTLHEPLARSLVERRHLEAESDVRARRLLAVRRWQRKAEVANRQVRLARLAVR